VEEHIDICTISGFHHNIDTCAVVGYYAALSGNFLELPLISASRRSQIS